LKGAADGVDTLLSATPQPGEQWVRCEDQAPYFVGHYDAYSPSDGGRYPDAYWDGERWENEMDGFPIRGVTHYCTPVMPQPEAGEQWVRCEDRLPTEDDADCFGNVWASISSGEWVWIPWKAVVEAHMDDSLWMQTGLTRPKPPKGGEPGKDKSCKYCYGGITDGVGNGCTCPQPPKE